MFDLLEPLPKPLAQMPLYPVTDIETDYPSWELYGEGLLLDHADVAVFDAACLDNSPLPRQHILNCPMLGDNSKVCPTYIVAAELDVLRDEAFAYAKQLKVHGVAVETHTILGTPHGFIHFMSIHQGIGQKTGDIIKGFTSFVRDVINTQSQLAA
ncbi:lipase-esterase [Psychrobacter sp. JCM 18903]|nr:alpha/beta hydrolase fold domain-containing protein [Psychrobacter sp. JCM 18903]GAF61827.1 lipase-esterase [Psychrobacter sp. JCM 18903]